MAISSANPVSQTALPRVERWERRTQLPLLALALLFAVAYAAPIVDADASTEVRRLYLAIEWAVWAAFAVDYLIRLWLAEDRRRFLRTHLLDLVAVLLPLIQPLRLLRLISTLLLVGKRARSTVQVKVTTYVGGSLMVLLLFGSLAVLEVERDVEGSNIRTLGDASWWAFTTMTTVGYGDYAPTTGPGRVLAVALMLSGITLIGLVTANIAAWFISQFQRESEVDKAQNAAIIELSEQIIALRAEVARLSSRPDPDPPRSS